MTSVCLCLCVCIVCRWVFFNQGCWCEGGWKPLWEYSTWLGGKALPPPPSFAFLQFSFSPSSPSLILPPLSTLAISSWLPLPSPLLFPYPIFPIHAAHSSSGASFPAIAVSMPALICIRSFLCPPSFTFYPFTPDPSLSPLMWAVKDIAQSMMISRSNVPRNQGLHRHELKSIFSMSFIFLSNILSALKFIS